MKDYLEKTLRQHVAISEADALYKKLPLFYRGRYDVLEINTNGVRWMAIHPKETARLVMLRKDRLTLEQLTGLNCAIFLDYTTFYIQEKLLEEGIPFVIKGKQVYLPFLGYLLTSSRRKEVPPVHMISYLAQKMMLLAMYEKWEEVKVSDAAERLGISRKSASRCFDEIEYLKIDMLGIKGKTRVMNAPKNPKLFWEHYAQLLRSPVVRRFLLRDDIALAPKAGISALCDYSLLSDNRYPTYAVTKKEIAASGVNSASQVGIGEEVGCAVLELGYFIDFDGKGTQDPLSVALSLTEEELRDERVEGSVEDMLEEYVWSKG
ncbi:MAG: hypothetical protein J5622_01020 [Firmicutes bacterium]|nr:hypothetical protein [Bacillota bacterium]